MGLLDAPLRNVAKTLVQTFGTSIVFEFSTAGTYKTTTGTQKPNVVKSSVKGVMAEYANHERGDNIQLGDRKLIVAASALDVTPNTDDGVTINGSKYRIVRNTATFATDQAAIFELQIRGGTV